MSDYEGFAPMLDIHVEIAFCVVCGCDDWHANRPDAGTGAACHWVRVDREESLGLCSVCACSSPDAVKCWDRGERTRTQQSCVAQEQNWE